MPHKTNDFLKSVTEAEFWGFYFCTSSGQYEGKKKQKQKQQQNTEK